MDLIAYVAFGHTYCWKYYF